MGTQNSRQQSHGSYSSQGRSYRSPVSHRINARARAADPRSNIGASTASDEIRAQQFHWSRPTGHTTPDFTKKRGDNANQPGATAGGGLWGNVIAGAVKAADDARKTAVPSAGGDRAAAGRKTPQSTGAGSAPAPAGPATPPLNPMLSAMQKHPFANGMTLPQNMNPSTFRQTGAGYETLVNSAGGPRWVAVSPTLDQAMSARTGGRWDSLSPAQRGQYLRSGALPPEPVAAQQFTSAQAGGDSPQKPALSGDSAKVTVTGGDGKPPQFQPPPVTLPNKPELTPALKATMPWLASSGANAGLDQWRNSLETTLRDNPLNTPPGGKLVVGGANTGAQGAGTLKLGDQRSLTIGASDAGRNPAGVGPGSLTTSGPGGTVTIGVNNANGTGTQARKAPSFLDPAPGPGGTVTFDGGSTGAQALPAGNTPSFLEPRRDSGN